MKNKLFFVSAFALAFFVCGYFFGLKQKKIIHFLETGKWRSPKIQDNTAVLPKMVHKNCSFVILVASYNNASLCKENIQSILKQDYPFYRVIYFDDASTDDTLKEVENLVNASAHKEKFTLIRNEVNQGAMANIYAGCTSCKDDEIVVILDGDDAFACPSVLSTLNAYYNDQNVWMTYGQCLNYPSCEVGPSRPLDIEDLKHAKIRQMTWRTSHLRTFYAGLFKQISIDDLMYQGKFLETTCDLAIMFPMIEMAREHAVFIPNIFYIYNESNPLSDLKVKREKQLFYDKYIRSKPCYDKIESLKFL